MAPWKIVPITPEQAQEIAAWRYPGKYAFYNWDESGDLAGLLDGSVYAALDGEALAGFYQFGAEARIPTLEPEPYAPGPLDIGLGLRPDLCGRGLGERFVRAGMAFAREQLGAGGFRLTVAAFNARAQKVYARCGFTALRKVTHQASGAAFIVMIQNGITS